MRAELRVVTLLLILTTWATPSRLMAGPVDVQPFFNALSVADADRSAAWYEKVFGFEVIRSMDLEERGIRVRILRSAGGLLELIEHRDARPVAEIDPALESRFKAHGMFKFGFVTPDLDRAVLDLQALDVPLRGSVIEEPEASLRSLQVEDPDGNIIQIFEIVDPVEEGSSEE